MHLHRRLMMPNQGPDCSRGWASRTHAYVRAGRTDAYPSQETEVGRAALVRKDVCRVSCCQTAVCALCRLLLSMSSLLLKEVISGSRLRRSDSN